MVRFLEPASSAPLPLRAIRAYHALLQSHPLVAKSLTSAVLGALADITAQHIQARSSRSQFNTASTSRYALLGLLVTGPATHHFYRWLDMLIPAGSLLSATGLLRLAVDRLAFGPAFLLVSLYLLNRLEGKSHEATICLIRRGFWPMLMANLRFWVPLQYVNVNYVPPLYRVLFGNFCAFFWIVVMANKRRQASERTAVEPNSREN